MQYKDSRVKIEQGIQDWQVIQQYNGYGEISLEGTHQAEEIGKKEIWVRIVSETTGESIQWWKKTHRKNILQWNIKLCDIPVGGPYRIESCMTDSEDEGRLWEAEHGDMRHHIYVGDVYIIAGQSNAAGYGKDPISDEPELGVHMFRHNGKWDLASHPLNDSTDTEYKAIIEKMNAGQSPYLHFAKYVKKETGCPIGLIPTALGASPLKQWMPNGSLYNNMITMTRDASPIGVKGIFWYQGCADAIDGNTENFKNDFEKVIEGWRHEFGKDIPVFMFQLNRLVCQSTEGSDKSWSCIRAMQRKTAKDISRVYILPTLDVSLSDQIHNSSSANLILGERLAKAVLAVIYGKKMQWKAPDFQTAWTVEEMLYLEFDSVYGGLFSYEIPPEETSFVIEDEKGRIGIKEYFCQKNQICIKLERCPQGKCFVSGGYGQNPKGILPVDFANHFPIIAFCKEQIEKRRKK